MAKQIPLDTSISMLDNLNPEVRLLATRELTKSKKPEAISALISALKDPFLCGEVLDNFGRSPFDVKSVDLLLSVANENNYITDHFVFEKLKQIGPAATNTLLNALQKPNMREHLMAARVLAALKDVRAAEPLLNMVEEGKLGEFGWFIIKALAEIGEPAIQILLSRLRPGADSVSLTAVHSLEEMGSVAIPILIQAMRNSKAEPYTRYKCGEIISSICEKNKAGLKERWQTCVCNEHLIGFQKLSLTFGTVVRRIFELRRRDYYLRQHPFLSRLADNGILSTGFNAFLDNAIRTIIYSDYYACPICSQDRAYFSPVLQIVLVLDDRAKHSTPIVKNQKLYVPWSPLISAFRFHRMEIRSIAYPYSTSIERFVYRLELERRNRKTPSAPHELRIPCLISASCKLSAADQNRLRVYCNLQ